MLSKSRKSATKNGTSICTLGTTSVIKLTKLGKRVKKTASNDNFLTLLEIRKNNIHLEQEIMSFHAT